MMETLPDVSLTPAISDSPQFILFGSGSGIGDLTTTPGLKKEDTMMVKPEEIKSLLELFSKTTYKAKDTQPKIQHVIQRCLSLFDLDYKYSVLPNPGGDLSTNYPSSLVILESEKGSFENSNHKLTNGDSNCSYTYSNHMNFNTTGICASSTISSTTSSLSLNGTQDNVLELPKLKEMCSKARFARCRARFPIPVILYNNKHICRSATLSGGPEIYGRSSFDYFFSGGGIDAEPGDEEIVVSEAQSDWQLFDRVRSQDIRLLRAFKVTTIVDLMVEKKKVKFGVNVTSSEKVDKENRYSNFNIVSLPYPGCEFFKQYRDNGYRAEELVFEWNQGHVDANICVPSDATAASLKLDWSHYRDWDLVVLTQNYLKLLLAYLRERESGLLIHCISGWDRTPLFVSLLRLSLWADGQIHKSLDADQILYLTLAYDWLLFGHNLEDRLSKGEEILFFCFNFLKYIVEPEFRVDQIPEPQKCSLLSRVRNDSDVHLEGVLLDGEVSHTSPEGSNWSLDSCSSSQSSKSQDNPPAYFQVTQDSWEDCNGAQHLLMSQHNSRNGSLAQSISNPKLTANGHLTTSCIITASMINSTNTLPSSSLTSSNGDNGFNSELCNSTASPLIQSNFLNCSSSPVPIGSSPKKENGTNGYLNGGHHGRTSPVAVPVSSRLSSHSHQGRPESNSSASIGSWQFISASLRDTTISTSDPGSGSFHSNPTRLPINSAAECIEASESSCTLVGEISPMGSKPRFMSSTFKCDGVNGIAVSTLSQALRDELDLALAYDETDSAPFETSSCVQTPETLTFSLPREEDASVCTATTTPTKEQEDDEDQLDGHGSVFLNNNNNNDTTLLNAARRRERLEKVRNCFYNLYEGTIGLPTCRAVSESNGSSGLGFLIGNLATKVGIRSAAPLHRTSHV